MMDGAQIVKFSINCQKTCKPIWNTILSMRGKVVYVTPLQDSAVSATPPIRYPNANIRATAVLVYIWNASRGLGGKWRRDQ